VEKNQHGMRLDVWLPIAFPGLSRRAAQSLIASGDVRLDGRRVAKSHSLLQGQTVTLSALPLEDDWHALPCPDIALEVLYEDACLFAVNKPCGLPSVPLRRNDAPTLAGAIAARFPECAVLQRQRGDSGLIGRLDTATSGLVLAGRTESAFRALIEMQTAGRIEKSYLALIRPGGAVPGLIDAPLSPAGPDATEMKESLRGTRRTTRIAVLQSTAQWTLVRATIHRGMRHQIRAHLASVGAPIAGDPLYGGPALPGLTRMFLHAARCRTTSNR
jgi:23S rRNA pseudouridine1911/1915/1917 synthase